MLVLVPKTSGFCPGVKRAEEGVFSLRETHNSVNLHGPLIHNKNYISMLESHNIKETPISSLNEGDTLVIRTHGISKHEERELSSKFVLQDLTCPIVKRVQKHVEKASLEGALVVISGKAPHAEVQGLVSYAEHYVVIENQQELDQFLVNHTTIIPSTVSKIFVLSQTTYSREFFETMCVQIQQSITQLPVIIKNTICPITENKEQESLELQKGVDFTVVIGDPTSSNSKKLFAVLKNGSPNTVFTQNLEHLKNQHIPWEQYQSVLVVSSTSTPFFIEREIRDYLENF